MNWNWKKLTETQPAPGTEVLLLAKGTQKIVHVPQVPNHTVDPRDSIYSHWCEVVLPPKPDPLDEFWDRLSPSDQGPDAKIVVSPSRGCFIKNHITKDTVKFIWGTAKDAFCKELKDAMLGVKDLEEYAAFCKYIAKKFNINLDEKQ